MNTNIKWIFYQYLLLRTKSTSASLNLLTESLRAISLSTLDNSRSAANLDLLKAAPTSSRDSANSVSTLDLLRALLTAMSVAILDLLKAASVSR